MEVFPGGGGLVLDPDPIRGNAQLHQLLPHGGGLGHRLVVALAAGNHGDHVRVLGQVVIGPVDPIPQGGGGAGDANLGSQHHQIFDGFVGRAEACLDNNALGDGNDGDADGKADSENPADDWESQRGRWEEAFR